MYVSVSAPFSICTCTAVHIADKCHLTTSQRSRAVVPILPMPASRGAADLARVYRDRDLRSPLIEALRACTPF